MKIELWSYLNHWYWLRLNYDLWLDYLQIFFSLMFVSSASRVYGEAAAALVCWGFFLRWGTSKVLPSRSPLSSVSAPCIILPREQWKLSNLILPHFSWYCRCHLSRLMVAFPPLWRSFHCPLPSPSCQAQTAHLPFPDSYLCTLLKLLPATLPNTRQ